MGTVKPHEEAWQAAGRRLHVEEDETEEVATFWGDNDEGRCQLAACAPEMARMLLELEWGGEDISQGETMGSCCPSCGERAPHDVVHRFEDGPHREGGVHAGDCALDALLRKAGVR